MKFAQSLLLFLLSICFILPAQAQKVYENELGMSLGVQNALYVDIEGADRKIAEKVWKDYIEDYGKIKYNRKAKEHRTMMVRLPAVSTSQDVDVYAKFEEMGSLSRAYFWFDMGDGFFNTIDYEENAEGAVLFIKEYVMDVKKKIYNEELEDQEDELKDLQKDLEKLEDQKEDFLEDIEEARKKIAEREQDIEKNLIEQEDKRQEILKQQKVVEQIIERLNSLRIH